MWRIFLSSKDGRSTYLWILLTWVKCTYVICSTPLIESRRMTLTGTTTQHKCFLDEGWFAEDASRLISFGFFGHKLPVTQQTKDLRYAGADVACKDQDLLFPMCYAATHLHRYRVNYLMHLANRRFLGSRNPVYARSANTSTEIARLGKFFRSRQAKRRRLKGKQDNQVDSFCQSRKSFARFQWCM